MGNILLKLYSLLLIIIFPPLLTIIFIKNIICKKNTITYLKKLGIITPKIKSKKIIWIHGVSAGEVASTETLLKEIKKHKILLTTTSKSGMLKAKDLKRKYKEKVTINYFPYDYKIICKKILNKIKPKIIIVIESEIWPNFIEQAKRQKIPCYIVNCYFSKRAFQGYKLLKNLFEKTLSNYKHFYVQSKTISKYLETLKVPSNKISLTTNLKLKEQKLKKNKYLNNSNKKNIIITAGSTHQGEEKIILKAYQNLIKTNRKICLIIAPRNPNRCKKLYKKVKNPKLKKHILNKINNTKSEIKKIKKLAKINNIIFISYFGKLNLLYKLSNIAIIGGSFKKSVGCHNILEAIMLKIPTIVGPHTENYKNIIQKLKKIKAIKQILKQKKIPREDALKKIIEKTLKEKINIKIKKVKKILSQNAKSTKEILNEIIK